MVGGIFSFCPNSLAIDMDIYAQTMVHPDHMLYIKDGCNHSGIAHRCVKSHCEAFQT